MEGYAGGAIGAVEGCCLQGRGGKLSVMWRKSKQKEELFSIW